MTREDGTHSLSRNVGKKLTTTRRVVTQKSAVFKLREGLSRNSPPFVEPKCSLPCSQHDLSSLFDMLEITFFLQPSG